MFYSCIEILQSVHLLYFINTCLRFFLQSHHCLNNPCWNALGKLINIFSDTLFLVHLYVFSFRFLHTTYLSDYTSYRTQIYIIIIIIMSRRQRGYPWPSLAISPYHSSPPAGLQGYILCPHIVAVCKFVLVVLLLHIHMWGSTGVHRLWARPCFVSGSSDNKYIYIYIYKYGYALMFIDTPKGTHICIYIHKNIQIYLYTGIYKCTKMYFLRVCIRQPISDVFICTSPYYCHLPWSLEL